MKEVKSAVQAQQTKAAVNEALITETKQDVKDLKTAFDKKDENWTGQFQAVWRNIGVRPEDKKGA